MTRRDIVLKELQEMPEPLLEEVLDFVRYLRDKVAREGFETAIASEPALGRDWLTPEEDAAWADL
jgi:hypothetical protein